MYTILSTGVKGQPLVFLLTDSQIVDDRFLVYINALLSSGWYAHPCVRMTHIHNLCRLCFNRTQHNRRIPDLFPKDELDVLLTAPGPLRAEAKAQVRTSVHLDVCVLLLYVDGSVCACTRACILH